MGRMSAARNPMAATLSSSRQVSCTLWRGSQPAGKSRSGAPAPERLFPAGWLPLQSVHDTCRELERVAAMGFRAALIRPIDARGRYPSFIFPSFTGGTPTATMDRVFRTFEETGLVLGMHTFPATNPDLGAAARLPTPPANMMSP